MSPAIEGDRQLTTTPAYKNHYTFPNLDNRINSFYHSYISDGDHLHQQNYLPESYSTPLTDTNYLQNQGSNLVTITDGNKRTCENHHLLKGYFS